MASSALAATLAAGLWASLASQALSGGETRTISLYHVHTGESLTVTYMVNGKYVPSAMKKINYLLRDWRRNQVITIDPRTIDLVWELHADLGSKKPVHIVCGYRSANTNAMLKRIGRNVARKSQHILGKAIDIYFPDVSTIKMRNSALVRQVGGVGYYRSAGGPTGFLHVDSGRVRHWGPGISAREMAKIFKDYRRTVGARLNKKDQVLLASTDTQEIKKGAQTAADNADSLDDEGMAQLAENSSQAPAVPKAKPTLVETSAGDTTVAAAEVVPKPRAKPIEILMAAAMNLKIEPASAPPEDGTGDQDSPVTDSTIGTVVAAETVMEPATQFSNGQAKGSFAKSIQDGTAEGVTTLRDLIIASTADGDLSAWPSQLTVTMEQQLRLNGYPQPWSESATASILPGGNAEAAEVPMLPQLAVAPSQETAPGKGDMLVVNREGKGNFGALPVQPKLQKVGQLEQP